MKLLKKEYGFGCKNEIIFSDMAHVKPSNSVSHHVIKTAWQAIDYSTETFDGTMLMAHGTMTVPKITLDPELTGWHAVYIGILQTVGVFATIPGTGFRISDEKYPHIIAYDFYGDFAKAPYIEDAFWKYCDITDKTIEISHPEGGVPKISSVAYLRFVPLDEHDIKTVIEDKESSRFNTMIATHDIHGALCYKNPKTSDDMTEELQPFLDSDISHIMLEYYYDSFENNLNGNLFWDMSRYGVYRDQENEFFIESLDRFISRNENFYIPMIEYAHKAGKKVGLSYRMNPFANQPPWDIGFNSNFFYENPQLRCKDHDGSEIARMSYAYPEVRQIIIDMFKKMILSGADGIHMLFCRGVPNLLYEKPVIDAFLSETGKDPLKLDEQDEGFLKFRAKFFADTFLREVRKEINAAASSLGRHEIPFISMHVLADRRTNLHFALDLEYLAKERLVDIVVAYPSIMNRPDDFLYNKQETVDVRYYAELGEKYGIKTCVDLLPRGLTPEELRKRAVKTYDQGIKSLCVWDTYSYPHRLKYWNIVKMLGHYDEIRDIKPDGKSLLSYVKVIRMNGLKLDKYNPWWVL